MKQCPYCNAQIDDESKFCSECGKELLQRNVCAHCGTMVNKDDVYCEECGRNLKDGSYASASYGKIYSIFNKIYNIFNMNILLSILAGIVVGYVVLAIVGGSWYGYNAYSEYTDSLEKARPIAEVDTDFYEKDYYADSSGMARQDSKAIAEVSYNEKDNYADLWINVWGNIGDASMAVLQFENGDGWYAMSQDAPIDSRRTLKVNSYDKRSGRLIFNAYYKGDYIGILDGIFQSNEVEIEPGYTNVIQSYSGTFKSVQGVNIEFHFHGD